MRAEFGTATIAIGVGGVADNIKAGADFRLNADGTSPVLRSTKKLENIKTAHLRGRVITGNPGNCLRNLLKIFRKLFPESVSSMFMP